MNTSAGKADVELTEEQARYYLEFMTNKWPLEPFCCVMKSVGGGKFPDTGFIYRGQLGTIYLAHPGDLVSIDESLSEVKKEGGFAHFQYTPQITKLPPKEQIEEMLKKVPNKVYTDIKAAIADGWKPD